MPTVNYHHADGATDVLTPPAGSSVMRAAVQAGIRGIVGECGGQAMCATCHVYVRPDWLDALPEIGDEEDEMLDCTATPRDARRSRLACQLTLGADLEQIEVDVPGSQV